MKAQFWSFDILFAMIIFVSAVVLMTAVWLDISGQYSIGYGNGPQEMQAQLQSLSGRITGTGYPQSWYSAVDPSNSETWNNISIGLGSASGGISEKKVEELIAMDSVDYQYTKSLVGTGYDYYIIIGNSNLNITMGMSPAAGNAVSIQSVEKPVTIGGAGAVMTVELWTNTTFGID